MMQPLICFFVNSLCCLMYRRQAHQFLKITDLAKVQQDKLFHILKQNETCEYGKRYGFSSINSIAEFQHKVPLTIFEDYLEEIDHIKNGAPNVLTCETVLLLEPTSGSTSASKLIPYTRSLKADFQQALQPWIYNLYTSYPGIKWGKSYWSVSPVSTQKEYTPGGVPVGFEEDSEYFGDLEQMLFKLIFAVSKQVAHQASLDDFYYQTSLSLLKCSNLTLISIWHPTFLLLLLEYMKVNSQQLSLELAKKDKRRGEEIGALLAANAYHKLWRNLTVISCWSDANAASYAGKLASLFPGVHLQPKGLLATEGVVSIPLAGEDGARLAVNSHFFEFQSLDDDQIYLTHQLQIGQQYAVIMTTSGGLYRYRLNDIIEITGFKGIIPLVRFKGKLDRVSDLFGEKLNEVFVKDIFEKSGLNLDFCMLAPETDRYVLYTKNDQIGVNIDDALRANFHYDYCRKLGQLKELKIFLLTGDPEQEYIAECIRRGQKLGNIKTTVLALQGGWEKAFKGGYL